MSYCTKCGSKLDQDSLFCPQCGTPVEGSAPKTAGQFGFDRLGKGSVDTTYAFSEQDIAKNKLFCLLCYFGVLVLIPLLVKKDSPFVRFHTNQGLILLVFNVAFSLLAIIPFLGGIIGFVGQAAAFVFWILGLINVMNGSAKTLPVIGGITLIK